jgi:hypothetical protein
MAGNQVFGSWVQATGWSTALASVADAGTSTSGQVDNSSSKSIGMDVSLAVDKDSATGTGVVELWMLPEGNDGAAQDADPPSRGGRLIGVMSTAAETTQRLQVFRAYDLPEKFKFYIINNSGIGFNTTTDVRYRLIDFI